MSSRLFSALLRSRPCAEPFRPRCLPHLAPSRPSPIPHPRKPPSRCTSEEHTSELHSPDHVVCRLLLVNDPATTEIYPLSLHDALPISDPPEKARVGQGPP